MNLVLSLFPGIDILGRGFEEEGFCVVRGPDLIFGQSIETFHAPAGKFDGVIAGSPCQNFTLANHSRDKAKGEWALEEFRRLVTETESGWWLLENVPTVPDLRIEGYTWQRLDLWAHEFGLRQRRLRHIQFGSRNAITLIVDRDAAGIDNPGTLTLERCCLADEGRRAHKRRWSKFCELQGLPGFDLPGWSLEFKYRAVGNAVPLPMARALARAVQAAVEGRNEGVSVCECGCGRRITKTTIRRQYAKDACRKRVQARRARVES